MKSKKALVAVAFLLANPFRTDKLLLSLHLNNNELYCTNYKLVIYFVFLNHVHVKESFIGANFLFGNNLIIVCGSEKLKNKKKTPTLILLDHINNSTLAFPWQLPSKKQFNLSRCNFWGSHCSWSVKSHVDTCRVGMGQGAWKKDIWMNIDISLAPCGVSTGGTRACKTLTEERPPPVTETLLLFFFFPTRMKYSTLFYEQRSK